MLNIVGTCKGWARAADASQCMRVDVLARESVMSRIPGIVLGALILFGVAVAEAGLWQNIYRGLDLVATPTGSPVVTTGDGTRVNGARSGRLRIVPNGVFGKGYRLEFDRTFGADSRGRPEVFRLGVFGDVTLQGGTQVTAGYNQFFNKRYKTGFADVTINGLRYDVRTKVGLQDAELSGTLNLAGALDINMLGFYELTFNASNTNSTFKLDGVVVRDEQATNFDVGPISVRGNIFVDGLLAGVASTGLVPDNLTAIFPKSPIDRITDAIAEQVQRETAVLGDSVTADVPTLVLRTVLQQDGDAAQQLASALAANADLQAASRSSDASRSVVPEPGTLLLMACGAALLGYRRHR